jgi:multicomponent Na+:H+ antiporter subunit A
VAVPALLPVALALAAAPLTAAVGAVRPRAAAPVAVGTASMAFVACLATWWAGSAAVDLPWAPTWGLRLRFHFDGLATLYAVLTTGVAVAVTVYATAYVPRHLHHQERPREEAVRFHALILLFMGAMLGLVAAGDGLLLFLFWDLTAVTSYFLIAFDRERAEARSAALMALLITGVTSILFLAGVVLLDLGTGSFAIDTWLDAAATPAAAALIAVAAVAKSAQVPLHFWLPRAMAAPTPVSAYLHSAAMVAAGVFVLTRLHPLIAAAPALSTALAVIGAASMAVGGLLAFAVDGLKTVLAYSTIAHYGYVTFLLALGGEHAVAAASFYVLAHGVAKSALFLAAGAVTEATGASTLARVGGLGARMPVLAAATAVAGAALAGLPLTIGYFKDELLFRVALDHGSVATAVAVAGAALTVAYTARFWTGIFLGPAAASVGSVEWRLIGPVVALAAVALGGGLHPGPAARLAAAAALRAPESVELEYQLLRTETALAIVVWIVGIAMVVVPSPLTAVATVIRQAGSRAGPERLYRIGLHTLNRFSRRLRRIEQRDLRSRVTPVLAPLAVLVGLALVATGGWRRIDVGDLSTVDMPLAIAVSIAAAAAIATARRRRHLAIVVTLSTVGFSLAAAYAFSGAPDVALVAVLIETLLTLLFVGMLALFPLAVLRCEVRRAPPRGRFWRDVVMSLVAGALALAVALKTLSGPTPPHPVAAEYLRLAPDAHGRDAVTVILADFRGLDTLGEITVLAIAFAGVLTLLRRQAP